MSAARELAATIAGKAPLATRAVKAAVDAGEGRSVAETFVAMRGGNAVLSSIFVRVSFPAIEKTQPGVFGATIETPRSTKPGRTLPYLSMNSIACWSAAGETRKMPV